MATRFEVDGGQSKTGEELHWACGREVYCDLKTFHRLGGATMKNPIPTPALPCPSAAAIERECPVYMDIGCLGLMSHHASAGQQHVDDRVGVVQPRRAFS